MAQPVRCVSDISSIDDIDVDSKFELQSNAFELTGPIAYNTRVWVLRCEHNLGVAPSEIPAPVCNLLFYVNHTLLLVDLQPHLTAKPTLRWIFDNDCVLSVMTLANPHLHLHQVRVEWFDSRSVWDIDMDLFAN